MKITKKEISKAIQTMLLSFIAVGIYYFIYSINPEYAHNLAVFCVICIIIKCNRTKLNFLVN